MEEYKTRHKTNWERVIDALYVLRRQWSKDAVATLEAELLPKYEALKKHRASVRQAVRKHRQQHDRSETKAQRRAHAQNYYANHKAQCNAAAIACHRRRRIAERVADAIYPS